MAGIILHSDQEINEHLHCEKVLLVRPRKPSEKNRNVSQRFKVQATNTKLEYSVFVTYSERMPQDFSLGLMLDDYLLLRCNGFHGSTRNKALVGHHAYPHGHLLTMEDVQNGRAKKPSKIIDFTGKYIDLQTAKRFFFQECGILDPEDYFNLSQYSLFEGGDTGGDSE